MYVHLSKLKTILWAYKQTLLFVGLGFCLFCIVGCVFIDKVGKARQSTFHTQGRLKMLHIETLAYNKIK